MKNHIRNISLSYGSYFVNYTLNWFLIYFKIIRNKKVLYHFSFVRKTALMRKRQSLYEASRNTISQIC